MLIFEDKHFIKKPLEIKRFFVVRLLKKFSNTLKKQQEKRNVENLFEKDTSNLFNRMQCRKWPVVLWCFQFYQLVR